MTLSCTLLCFIVILQRNPHVRQVFSIRFQPFGIFQMKDSKHTEMASYTAGLKFKNRVYGEII